MPALLPASPAFLRAVRRRSVVGDVLTAAFAAAVLNETIRWLSIAVFWWTRWDLPVLDVGPVFLAALVPYLWQRWSPAAVARRADARLGLSDRLASFVDFAGRSDISPEVRGAQARETERMLTGARPAGAAPIRAWLALGPLLLAASLAYPYFIATPTEPLTIKVLRRITGVTPFGGRTQLAGTAKPEGDPRGSNRKEEGATTDPQSANPGVRAHADRDEPKTPPAHPPQESASGEKADGTAGGGKKPGKAEGEDPTGPPPDHPDKREPQELVSERIGSRLASVVDPLYAPSQATQRPATVPAGTISIALVPKGRTGRGTRQAPGQADVPERVAVNLDALPEQYRPLVKTYFELLAAGGRNGDTPLTRSGGP